MEAKHFSPSISTMYFTKQSSSKISQCHQYQSYILPKSIKLKHFPLHVHHRKTVTRLLGIRALASSLETKRRPVGSRDESSSSMKGLGIVEFLKGKNILVAGATGFLGKVVMEKILRTQPEVGKLFLVIKAKDIESASHRLKKEIICSELFKCVRSIHGSNYEAFMHTKLVPILGDISADKLGIKQDVADKLAQQVDIILNSAANTNFDERYDVALETNTMGPSRLMELGKSFKRLQLFLHVSTAYANGLRKSRVMEKPFRMGDTIAKGLQGTEFPTLDISQEFELCKRAQKSNQEMKTLGMERAIKHGWHDVYTFSKAMGEMLLDYNRGQIPVAIIRPSIIEGTYNDPFPGWIEGLRMMDPVIVYYAKGQLTSFVGKSKNLLDIVPADMVANAILAAMAKHGSGELGLLEVYHVSSSAVNPITIEYTFDLIFQHFKSHPYINVEGKAIQVNKLKFFDTVEAFSSSMKEKTTFHRPSKIEQGSLSAKLEKQNGTDARLIHRITMMAETYRPYTIYKFIFDCSNTEGLFQDLSEEEKRVFGFDTKRIEWNDYLLNSHVPGLRRHVMKGRETNICPCASSSMGLAPL